MLRRPRLKTYLTLFPLAPARWGVTGGPDELRRIELRDERAIRAFARMLPLLDGRRESGAVLAELEGAGESRAAAEAILRHLEAANLLEEADDHGLPGEVAAEHAEQIRFFSRFTSEGGAKFQALLRRSRVAVLEVHAPRLARVTRSSLLAAGVGEVASLRLAEAPSAPWPVEAGVALSPPAGGPRPHLWREELTSAPPALAVVCLGAHDPDLLETMDRVSKQSGLPWLLVQSLSPQEGWVGPMFIPGETASYLSLAARLESNRPFAEDWRALDDLVRARGRAGAPAGGLAPAVDVLAGIAAAEAAKLLTGFAVPQLAGRFLSIHFGTWTTELHDVLRVPHLDPAEASGPAIYPWAEALYGDDDGAHCA